MLAFIVMIRSSLVDGRRAGLLTVAAPARTHPLANLFVRELLWYALATAVLTTGPMRRACIAMKSWFGRGAIMVPAALALRIAT